MLVFQMIIQSINTGNVIGMDMGENDLAHCSGSPNQVINTTGQRLLLILIWRSGIDQKDFAGGVNQVTVGMGSRWLCRRAYRKANVVGMKLDAAGWFSTRIGHG